MTRDPRRPLVADAFDDDTISQLVRDTASGWTMPPVRLDAPSWHERIRGPRARRVAAARGWFGRLGQAATAAVALTVVGSLVAVIITRPLTPASSPSPSGDATPGRSSGPTAAADATGLPKLILQGERPNPSKVVVEDEQGDFELVDLETGSISQSLTGAGHGSEMRVTADGNLVCLCLTESLFVGDSPTVASVALQRFAADGSRISSTPIDTFTGIPDPRDDGKVVPERPPHVLTALAFSADGAYGFVGWSLRAHPVWKSGIVLVDLASGKVVDRLALPDSGTGDADARRVVDAPHVVGVLGGGLMIARGWFRWAPVTSSNADYTFDNDVFSAGFAGGRFGTPSALPNVAGCGEGVLSGGMVAGGGSWLACSSGGSFSTVVRRFGPDGSRLGDTRVTGPSGIEGNLTAVSADGTGLFVWNPISAILTRVDLATGESRTGQGPIPAAAETGPLAVLGHWLAPTAAAKSFLRGGIVVSRDGARLYAIGIRSDVTGPEASGSTGVFAFDAATLASTGSFAPTADFVSLAVSGDGQSVYAAGLPGVDAGSASNAHFSASITVFNTTDGSVRLIAGQLGGEVLTFASQVVD